MCDSIAKEEVFPAIDKALEILRMRLGIQNTKNIEDTSLAEGSYLPSCDLDTDPIATPRLYDLASKYGHLRHYGCTKLEYSTNPVKFRSPPQRQNVAVEREYPLRKSFNKSSLADMFYEGSQKRKYFTCWSQLLEGNRRF